MCILQIARTRSRNSWFGLFEIDHFKPQSLNLPDTHKYHNLYYSCEKCNNEKSDIWDTKLLDPCTDDIFSGINPAIIGGKKRESL